VTVLSDQSVLTVSLPHAAVLSSKVIEYLAAQETALERFDDSIDLPFWPAFVLKEVLDAVPPGDAVKLATGPVIEELAVLLAHILLVFLAVLDLHAFPSNSACEEINLENKEI
jgi:hypothetical protein